MDPPPIQYVKTRDGYSLAYCVSGEGNPFLYVPDGLNHIELAWHLSILRRPLEELAARFQLIQYDGRGQGLSTRGLRDDYSVDDAVQDCETVVHELALQHFYLFGAGLGGQVATRFAVRHPEMVAALVLWNTPLSRRSLIAASWLEELAIAKSDLFFEASARLALPLEPLSAAMDWTRKSVAPADFVVRGRAFNRDGIEGIAEHVSIPTLVLASRPATSGGFYEYDERLSVDKLIPGARHALFDGPGAGFFSPGPETPPAIALIEDFLQELPVKPEDAPTGGERSRNSVMPSRLTAREIEVLRLISEGLSNREIAERLVLSLRTVERHITNVYAKIGARGRADATAYALHNSLT